MQESEGKEISFSITTESFANMKKVYSEPKFALVEAFNPLDPEGNYFIVEEFSSAEHLGKAGISLFDEQRDVEHLRNRILN